MMSSDIDYYILRRWKVQGVRSLPVVVVEALVIGVGLLLVFDGSLAVATGTNVASVGRPLFVFTLVELRVCTAARSIGDLLDLGPAGLADDGRRRGGSVRTATPVATVAAAVTNNCTRTLLDLEDGGVLLALLNTLPGIIFVVLALGSRRVVVLGRSTHDALDFRGFLDSLDTAGAVKVLGFVKAVLLKSFRGTHLGIGIRLGVEVTGWRGQAGLGVQVKFDTLEASRPFGVLALSFGEALEAPGLVADDAGELDGLSRSAVTASRLWFLVGAATGSVS